MTVKISENHFFTGRRQHKQLSPVLLYSILQHAHRCLPKCTPQLTHPIEIHVKCGLQKAKFLAYKLPGWFGTAIFLKFRIFLIILTQQRYMITWKFRENGRRSCTITQCLYRRQDPEKCCQKMYSQKSPEIIQKIINRISFCTEMVCMDPMKKISPNV